MQLLWNIDQGKLANIKGIPEDGKLKSSIKKLLKLLDLERGDDRDTFRLSPKSSPTLQVVGFVFEEAVEATRAIVNQHNETEARKRAQKEAARQAKESKRTAGSASESEEKATKAPPEASITAAAPQVPRRVVGPEMPSSAMLAAAAASMNDLPSDYFDEDAEDGIGAFVVGPPPPELVEEVDAAPQDERESEVLRIMKVPKALQLDAYAILGVSSTAATGEVKKRYMRLSLLIHPDKCSHKDAHEAFQLVSKAAKLLQDSGARKALDEHLEDVELRKLAEDEALKIEKERQWNIALGKESNLPTGPSSGSLPIRREQWMTELPPERKAPSREQQLSARNFSRTGIQERGDTTLWTDAPDSRGGERERERLGPHGSLLLGPSSGIGPSLPMSATAKAVEAFNSQYRKKTMMEEHLERLAAERRGGKDKGQKAEDKSTTAKEDKKRSRDLSDSSEESSEESSSSSERERHRKSRHKKDKSKKSKKDKKSSQKSTKRRDESWKQKLPAPSAPASKTREADWEAEGHPWQPWDRDKDLERKPAAMMNPGKVLAADAASRFATSSKTFL